MLKKQNFANFLLNSINTSVWGKALIVIGLVFSSTSCLSVSKGNDQKQIHASQSKAKDISVGDLKGLPIYPSIQEVLATDGKVYPGVLKILKESGWKYKRIENIGYFYRMEEDKLVDFHQHILNKLEKIKSFLNLDSQMMDKIDIIFFVFHPDWWQRLTMGDSFYLRGTRQIYVKQESSWCYFSDIAHELVHLILAKNWAGHDVPLWLHEGLATAIENPECFYKRHDVFEQWDSALNEKILYPLDQLILTQYMLPNQSLFYLEGYYLIQFLKNSLGDTRFNVFLKSYLNQDVLNSEQFKDIYNGSLNSNFNFEEIEKAFLDFKLGNNKEEIPQLEDLRLEFDNAVVHLGSVRRGESVTHAFTGMNNTSEDISINMARPLCGTFPEVSQYYLQPGEKTEITVTLDDTSSNGFMRKEYYIYLTSLRGQAVQTLVLEAEIKE